jgi:hypothetical protein
MNYISYTTEFISSSKDPVTFRLIGSMHSEKIDEKELLPYLEKCPDHWLFTSLPLSEDFHKALLEYFANGNTGISEKKLLKMYKETRDYKAKDLVKIERKEQKRRMKFDKFFHEQRMRFPYHFCTDETQVCINSNKVPKGIYAINERYGDYDPLRYTLISDDKEKLVKFITKCYKGDHLEDLLKHFGLN